MVKLVFVFLAFYNIYFYLNQLLLIFVNKSKFNIWTLKYLNLIFDTLKYLNLIFKTLLPFPHLFLLSPSCASTLPPFSLSLSHTRNTQRWFWSIYFFLLFSEPKKLFLYVFFKWVNKIEECFSTGLTTSKETFEIDENWRFYICSIFFSVIFRFWLWQWFSNMV